jgi:hypothetical protein
MIACQHILRPLSWPLSGNSELFCEHCGKTQKAINAERQAMNGDAAKVADPFKVQVTVFMPHTKNTSIKLKRGEHLFALTDNGLDEAGHTGPQEVLVIAEKFGVWPVVVFGTTAPDAWRNTTAEDHARMMARVRRHLSPTAVRAHLENNDE